MIRKIKIELLNKLTIINNKNTKAILETMLQYHDDPVVGGHCGIFGTGEKVERYYWKSMTKDTAKYVKSRQKCHLAKTTKHIKSPMTHRNTHYAI